MRARLGTTDVSLRLAWPGLPNADTIRSIELLASEVVPQVDR